jgi:hypothetical protein
VGSQSLPSGLLSPSSTWGRYNTIAFIIQQLLLKVQTATLVEVQSCTNDGGVSPVGFVNVIPLVNQVDAAGNPQPHTTVFNVPYMRIQGGSNAIILDPQAGDIGVAVFASRDISKIKSTKAQANPGSSRQFDFSDALYLGGMLNGIPSQFIQFNSSGISIVSPDTVTIEAPTIQLQGSVTISQSLSVTDDVTAGPSPISLLHHTHISGTPGNPTGPPLP